MRYFNKDYANFIISDEKEKQLEKEKLGMAEEHKERSRDMLARRGPLLAVFWALLSIAYGILVIHEYLNGARGSQLIIYILISVCWGIGAMLYCYEFRKARAEILKKPGNIKA